MGGVLGLRENPRPQIAATLIATAATASADCGTNQLNGTWRLQSVDSANSQDYLINAGNFGGIGVISQCSGCKVTLTVGAATFIGRTENLKDTDRKPLTMMFSSNVAGADIITLFKL